MSRREPQDPQGPEARAFREYLDRHPEHHDRVLRNRLHNPYQSSCDVGAAAAGLLVLAILLVGIVRLLTGRLFL